MKTFRTKPSIYVDVDTGLIINPNDNLFKIERSGSIHEQDKKNEDLIWIQWTFECSNVRMKEKQLTLNF